MIDLTHGFHALAKLLTDHVPSCASLPLRNSSLCFERYSLQNTRNFSLSFSSFFSAVSSSPFRRFFVATFAYVGSLGNQFPAVSVQFHRADIPIHYAAQRTQRTRVFLLRANARVAFISLREARRMTGETWTGHSERYRRQDVINLQESPGFYLMRFNAQFPDRLLTFPTVFLSKTYVTLRHCLSRLKCRSLG